MSTHEDERIVDEVLEWHDDAAIAGRWDDVAVCLSLVDVQREPKTVVIAHLLSATHAPRVDSIVGQSRRIVADIRAHWRGERTDALLLGLEI